MTTDHQANEVQVLDVTCPRCHSECGGFQGIRHRGGGLRAIYKCEDCEHTWPRRKLPEGVPIPDKPEAKVAVDPDAPKVLSPESQAIADRRAEESRAHTRYRRGTLERYVRKVLSFGTFAKDDGHPARTDATAGQRTVFMDTNPVATIFTEAGW